MGNSSQPVKKSDLENILDEAVDLAKRYGTKDSSAFINGVLDRIADELGRVDSDRPHRSSHSH
jgi:transcription termination factor NusB